MPHRLAHPYLILKETIGQFLLVLTTFFAPTGIILLSVGAFICLDTFYGYLKHKKNGTSNSKGLRGGIVPKSISYILFIMTIFILDKAILHEITNSFININFLVTKLMALVLIWIEWMSINENYKELRGVSLMDKFKSMLKGVASSVEAIKKIKE